MQPFRSKLKCLLAGRKHRRSMQHGISKFRDFIGRRTCTAQDFTCSRCHLSLSARRSLGRHQGARPDRGLTAWPRALGGKCRYHGKVGRIPYPESESSMREWPPYPSSPRPGAARTSSSKRLPPGQRSSPVAINPHRRAPGPIQHHRRVAQLLRVAPRPPHLPLCPVPRFIILARSAAPTDSSLLCQLVVLPSSVE